MKVHPTQMREAPTPHKVLGPDIDGRVVPKGPLATPMGTGLS